MSDPGTFFAGMVLLALGLIFVWVSLFEVWVRRGELVMAAVLDVGTGTGYEGAKTHHAIVAGRYEGLAFSKKVGVRRRQYDELHPWEQPEIGVRCRVFRNRIVVRRQLPRLPSALLMTYFGFAFVTGLACLIAATSVIRDGF